MATKPSPKQTKTPKAAPKPALASKAAQPTPVIEDEMPAEEVKATAALKLKALIDRVTEASGAKRKDVKTIVEATLAQLGQALARGEAMNLPGLGHLRVARKGTAEAPTMTLKLRQSEPGKAKAADTGGSDDPDEKQPLAAESDQG